MKAIATYFLLPLTGMIFGYFLLNTAIPKAIYFAVESGYVEAPSNYSIYKDSIR